MRSTIHLSPNDVKQAIADYLFAKRMLAAPVKLGDIDLDVEETCTGYGLNEKYEKAFTGATIRNQVLRGHGMLVSEVPDARD